MLIIRQKQWEAMRQARREAFYRDLLKNIRTNQPELCADKSDDSVLEVIAWATKKAKAYGLFMSGDVIRFVHFVLRFGRDYQTRPEMAWAVGILNDLGLIGAQKLDRIEDQQPTGETS